MNNDFSFILREKEERRGVKPGSSPKKGPRTELVLITPETPGYKLVQFLYAEIAARSMTVAAAAKEMGVGTSTLSHLRTGRRLATQLERGLLERIADWLGIPVVTAMLMAEQMTLADFYSSGANELESGIERALDYIRKDPLWGSTISKSIHSWDSEAKLFVIHAYERATQTKILAGGNNYSDLLAQLKAFREEYPVRGEEEAQGLSEVPVQVLLTDFALAPTFRLPKTNHTHHIQHIPEKSRQTTISRAIHSLIEDYGLTFEAIGSVLAEKLGRKIALSTLHAWGKGSQPRKAHANEVEKALRELMDEHPIIEGGAWVSAEVVQARVQAWETLLTRNQIAYAANISEAVIHTWAAGKHRVKRPKWEAVVERVESVLDALAKERSAR